MVFQVATCVARGKSVPDSLNKRGDRLLHKSGENNADLKENRSSKRALIYKPMTCLRENYAGYLVCLHSRPTTALLRAGTYDHRSKEHFRVQNNKICNGSDLHNLGKDVVEGGDYFPEPNLRIGTGHNAGTFNIPTSYQ